jgi:hypothetical protein
MYLAMKKIKRAKITCVALCRRGKNGLKTLFKSDKAGGDEGTIEMQTLVKGDRIEEGELLAVVYAPNKPDSDGDFAEASVIKKMQRDYMRDFQEIDIEHEGEKLTKSQAYLAESFIVAKGDERFKNWKQYDGKPAGDLTGAWGAVFQIDDPALRKAFREEGWDGVSLFGTAAVEQVDTKAASQRVAERLSAALGKKDKIKMDKEELLALLKAHTEEIRTLLKGSVKTEETKPAIKAEIVPPDFEGDPSNPVDLEKFEKSMRVYELKTKLAAGKLTAAEISEMRKSLLETEPTDDEANVEKSDTQEVKVLKRQLFKAKKRTNAPEKIKKSEDDEDSSDETTLHKSRVKEGQSIGEIIAERRGYARSTKKSD